MPDTSAYQTIRVESDDGIDWLTLNRPERFNTLNAQLSAELLHYFAGLYDNHEVRVVILSGAGKHFCAGFDLDDTADITANPPTALRGQRTVSEIVMRMRRCPQPIIAMLHGAASGGGFALALAADIRYLAENARMNVAMAKVGLTGCDMGISYFLPRAVGASNAAELMMTGRFLDAEQALRIGLASAVCAAENLRPATAELAKDMLALSPLGLRLTKEGLNLSQDAGSLEAAIALEDRGQILCAASGYFAEGIAAFKEKRGADYADQ